MISRNHENRNDWLRFPGGQTNFDDDGVFFETALQLCNQRQDVGCDKCSILVRACMKVKEIKVIPNSWSAERDGSSYSPASYLVTIGDPARGVSSVYVLKKLSKEFYGVLYSVLSSAQKSTNDVSCPCTLAADLWENDPTKWPPLTLYEISYISPNTQVKL